MSLSYVHMYTIYTRVCWRRSVSTSTTPMACVTVLCTHVYYVTCHCPSTHVYYIYTRVLAQVCVDFYNADGASTLKLDMDSACILKSFIHSDLI